MNKLYEKQYFFIWDHEKSVLIPVSIAELVVHVFKINSIMDEMSAFH